MSVEDRNAAFFADLRALEGGKYYKTSRKLKHPTASDLYGPCKLFSTIQFAVANFCNRKSCYVEYGTYRGLTLLAAASVSEEVECFGIDNFSQFDVNGLNSSIINSQISMTGLRNAHLINADFDHAAESLVEEELKGKKIGAYFVDGAHDHRSHLMGMARMVPHLADDCAIIVDDTNYAHIRQAIADFLKLFPDFALALEAYVPVHPANLSGPDQGSAFRGWWNGVNVLVRDRDRRLPRNGPNDSDCPQLVMTHDLFRHEFADIAIDLLNDAQANEMAVLAERVEAFRRSEPTRYRYFNVRSERLPQFSLAE